MHYARSENPAEETQREERGENVDFLSSPLFFWTHTRSQRADRRECMRSAEFALAEVTERIGEELISMVSSTTATYALRNCYVLFVTDHYVDQMGRRERRSLKI